MGTQGYRGLRRLVRESPHRRAVGDNLGKLKELFQTGRTQLQDGRVERYVSAI